MLEIAQNARKTLPPPPPKKKPNPTFEIQNQNKGIEDILDTDSHCPYLHYLEKLNIKVVSSANDIIMELVCKLRISFIYIKNKSGPRIEPWDTPHVIWDREDLVSSISINCFLFVR